MSNLNPANPIGDAAGRAASVSGLPTSLTQALIMAEQPASDLNVKQNPFDVTADWLKLVNLGGVVTGLWNSVGVAIVNDADAAISGWWTGLSQFTNYSKFRSDLAGGGTVRQLVKDLGDAGYAGTDSAGWQANVLKIYSGNGGNVDSPPGGTAKPINGTITVLPGVNIPVPGIQVPEAFQLPAKAQIADPIQAIASAISNLPHDALGPFVDFFNQVHNFSVWLGQPNLWLRVLMILVGILLLVLGLILFAASFVPKGARLPLPAV